MTDEKEKKEYATTKEWVKYTFTEPEKKEMATEMALKITEMQKAEDEKKVVASQFKSQIDGLSAQLNHLANKLNTGYEMKLIECEIIPNYEKKVFTIRRLDNGMIVRNKAMTSDDMQMKLV